MHVFWALPHFSDFIKKKIGTVTIFYNFSAILFPTLMNYVFGLSADAPYLFLQVATLFLADKLFFTIWQ